MNETAMEQSALSALLSEIERATSRVNWSIDAERVLADKLFGPEPTGATDPRVPTSALDVRPLAESLSGAISDLHEKLDALGYQQNRFMGFA